MALTTSLGAKALRQVPRIASIQRGSSTLRSQKSGTFYMDQQLRFGSGARSATIQQAAIGVTEDRGIGASSSAADQSTWKIRMLYDGDCPLCLKEVDFLRQRDSATGNIDFVDIADPNYRAEDNAGVTFEQAMGHIHGITADGRVVKGVEVFQKLYEAVGLGWVYAITKWKPVYNVAESVYAFWAKYRLPMTGRPALEQVLESRQNEGMGCGDEDAVCEIPLDKLYPNGLPPKSDSQ